ncbi:hypothetical protein [Ornithinimicrobium kibberense]|uniref:hypothetical protein n=1 Tax=Ornithinimicrobium kibberense TaxID=282060 RepID=UPI003613E11C
MVAAVGRGGLGRRGGVHPAAPRRRADAGLERPADLWGEVRRPRSGAWRSAPRARGGRPPGAGPVLGAGRPGRVLDRDRRRGRAGPWPAVVRVLVPVVSGSLLTRSWTPPGRAG